jgi:hypothetical protein
VRAPERQSAMFLDDQGHFADVDLLDDARFHSGGLQAMPAVGAWLFTGCLADQAVRE